MGESPSRAGQINAVIDPKLLFLAKVAARYKGLTLVEFLEDSLRKALSRNAMMSDEPAVGHQIRPKVVEPLWFESLWDEDENVRLWNVATSLNLRALSPKQRALYLSATNRLNKQGKKPTSKNFIHAVNAERDSK